MRLLSLAVAVLATACILPAQEGAPAPKADKPAVTVADLPEAARTTAEAQSAGGTIDKIVVKEKDGAKQFILHITKDGAKSKIVVDADGKVVPMEKKEAK